MKYHKVGDLLAEVTEGIIVHGCNAQGVMGGGFALQVKNRYRGAYSEYQLFCMRERAVGEVNLVQVSDTLFIANAITQEFYGTHKRQVDYEGVAQCFETIAAQCARIPIHYPMIGAGLAGGNWTIISTIIDETLKGCDHTLWTLK